MNKSRKIRDATLAISLIGIVGLTVGVAVLANKTLNVQQAKETFNHDFVNQVFSNSKVKESVKTFLDSVKNKKLDNDVVKAAKKLLRKEILIIVRTKLELMWKNANWKKNLEEQTKAVKIFEKKIADTVIDKVLGEIDGNTMTGIYKIQKDKKNKIIGLIDKWFESLVSKEETMKELMIENSKVVQDPTNLKNLFSSSLTWNRKFMTLQSDKYVRITSEEIAKTNPNQYKIDGTLLDGTAGNTESSDSRRKSVELLNFLKSVKVTDEEKELMNVLIQKLNAKNNKVNEDIIKINIEGTGIEKKISIEKVSESIKKVEVLYDSEDLNWYFTQLKLAGLTIIKKITVDEIDYKKLPITFAGDFRYKKADLEMLELFIDEIKKFDMLETDIYGLNDSNDLKLRKVKAMIWNSAVHELANFDISSDKNIITFQNFSKMRKFFAHLIRNIKFEEIKFSDSLPEKRMRLVEVKSMLVKELNDFKSIFKYLNKERIFISGMIKELSTIDLIKVLSSVVGLKRASELSSSFEDKETKILIRELKRFIK